MDSFFRAAEELFEGVDRRAKRVVKERLTDDPSGLQNTDTSPLGRVLSTSPLAKVGLGRSSSLNPASQSNLAQADDNGRDSWQNGSATFRLNVPLDKENDRCLTSDESTAVVGNAEAVAEKLQHAGRLDPQTSDNDVNLKGLTVKTKRIDKTNGNEDHAHKSSKETGGIVSKAIESLEVGKDATEVSFHDANANITESNLGLELLDSESVKCKFVAENGFVTVELRTEKASIKESMVMEEIGRSEEDNLQGSERMANGSLTISTNGGRPDEPRQRDAAKVEEQLDEARGLLKTAVSSGQSKEARLARVCTGLSSRLQEYKIENSQLEELVHKERGAKTALERKVELLQSEILSAKAAGTAVEVEMSAALSSKNAEIEALLKTMEAIKRQATISEGKLATLQANVEAMARSRDMTETGMIQTLREELTAAEHRAEEERIAHSATRKAAAQRETELEQRVAESTAALTRMQKAVDERTQKAAELERKVSMLEVDCATLTQELQEMEARLRREQKRQPEEAAQTLQAWKEDAERARQAQREAEAKLSLLEAETQKLRVELASLKRDNDQHLAQAHIELEKRFRELTELLYQKQTQLEAMASEKAAAVLQIEKESRRYREAQAEAERHKSLRHSTVGWDEENDLKPLEYLGLQQRQLVGPSIQRAAKFLDSGAVTAGRFLWRRPLARLISLFYLVFVHVFLMYLLHRLQEQADSALASKEEIEAAAAAGLVKRGMQ